MQRSSGLYAVIGALVVVCVGLGSYVVYEQSKPKGIEVNIGENGISVQEN